MATLSPAFRNGKPKSSRFRGVSWDRQHSKWRSTITTQGKAVFIGLFDDEAEAAKAFDAKAIAEGRDPSRNNFPPVEIDPDTGVRKTRPADDAVLVQLDADGRGVCALVDKVDADRVGRRNWSHGTMTASGNPTPVTSIGGKTVSLGRYVLMLQKGERVVYRDGNPLNCRRENLERKGRPMLAYDEIEQDHGRRVADLERLVASEIRAEKRWKRLREQRIELEREIFAGRA